MQAFGKPCRLGAEDIQAEAACICLCVIEFVMLAARRWMSVRAPHAARSWRRYFQNWFLNSERIVSWTPACRQYPVAKS